MKDESSKRKCRSVNRLGILKVLKKSFNLFNIIDKSEFLMGFGIGEWLDSIFLDSYIYYDGLIIFLCRCFSIYMFS